MLEQSAIVLANEPVNEDYYRLQVARERGAPAAFAGQFFHILCPTTPDKAPFLRRPMSIYAASGDQKNLEFLYKVTGLGTRAMASLKAGDVLNIVGPLGKGFHIDPAWTSVWLVARGVGMATLAPVVEACIANKIRVHAILSGRRKDLIMSHRFDSLGAETICVHDEDLSSAPENIERHLESELRFARPNCIFTCGSRRLTSLMKRLCLSWEIPGQVALEEQMACGLGTCFCCVKEFCSIDGHTSYRRVCTEGPVFDLREVVL